MCIMNQITALLRRLFNQPRSLNSFSPLSHKLVAVKTVITRTERLNAHERERERKKSKRRILYSGVQTAFGANVDVWTVRETACGRGVRQE